MSMFPVRDVTALNVTNAVLGLSVLAILVTVITQAVREFMSWRRSGRRPEGPATVPGKRS